jgi:O-antigen/teichoic acid export membrane protein
MAPANTVEHPPPPVGAAAAVPVPVSDATRRHLRGSSLLLAGRLLSVAINFGAQVMIVRYLSKTDYGAFAYALTLVAMGESIAALGLDKAVSRFLPIYEEEKSYDKLFGTMLLVAGTILSLGLAVVLLVFGFRGVLGDSLGDNGDTITILLILIVLAPIQAFDDLLMGTFAVFSRPRAIFFRKYVLGPGFRLVAVVAVIATSGDVEGLAIGYVVAGAAGIGLYTWLLARTLRADGLLAHLRIRALELPWREIYGFALPLLAVDLLFVVMNTANVVMLGAFGTATDVADYRVVQPAAHLNLLVMTSFTLLFTPLAARLFARGDRAGIEDLYWRSAVWIAVCSFPIFALTFASSGPLTTAMFGDRYASSGPILALLSLGYYFSAALGFNGLTLRVFGLVKYTVVISLLAAVLNVALNLFLIPAYGATGAGIATCATFIVHNLLKQAGLRKGTGISVLQVRHVRVYGVIVAAAAALFAVERILSLPAAGSLALVAAASGAVVLLTRRSLQVADTFPELLQVPFLRRVVR